MVGRVKNVAMTLDRIVRGAVRWGLLAGLGLAVVLVSPLANTRGFSFGIAGRIVYVQDADGALAIGLIRGTPTPYSVPQRRDSGILSVLRSQIQTGTFVLGGRNSFDSRLGKRHALLGVRMEWLEVYGNANAPATWVRDEFAIPAWLLGLPGLIWLAVRGFRRLDSPTHRRRPVAQTSEPGTE